MSQYRDSVSPLTQVSLRFNGYPTKIRLLSRATRWLNIWYKGRGFHSVVHTLISGLFHAPYHRGHRSWRKRTLYISNMLAHRIPHFILEIIQDIGDVLRQVDLFASISHNLHPSANPPTPVVFPTQISFPLSVIFQQYTLPPSLLSSPLQPI